MINLHRIQIWDDYETDPQFKYFCYICKKRIYHKANSPIYEVTGVTPIIGKYGYTCSHNCAELLLLKVKKKKKRK